MRLLLTALLLIPTCISWGQTDTLRPADGKLNMTAWRDSKSTYAVFFEDSTGKRLSSAALWDRTLRRTTQAGQSRYAFAWDWYQKDSLIAHVTTSGQWPSMAPLTHQATYTKGGKHQFVFRDNVVTIPDSARRTAKDSSFRVTMQPAAFSFPMDLELFALLPFKQVGQQFAMAFYEPGSPRSAYYPVRVTGRAPLPLVDQANLDCWLIQIDYGRGSSATFWISDQPREVVKMKESIGGGRYRLKVKLY